MMRVMCSKRLGEWQVESVSMSQSNRRGPSKPGGTYGSFSISAVRVRDVSSLRGLRSIDVGSIFEIEHE